MITKKRKREELQLLRDEALDAYLNREDFQYDVNADALYQRYKDSYTQLGKTATEDTMGRASALTGGYGSSYAQSVGQQAYQSYLSKADDVIPELYQLAYERYRDESKRLYRNYQAWARQEQEAAQQERWEQEYALAQQKLRAENARQEGKNSQTQTTVTQPDYWAMLSYHQNLGKSTESKSTATNSTATNSIPVEAQYDNGKVSEGNIKTMQRLLGLTDTGKWTSLEQETAGNRSADDAWLDYQQGKLQSRSKSGMSMEKWATYRNEQSKASAATDTKGTTSRVENFIAGMVTEDQAAERGVSSEDWKRMVMERLNRVSLSVDEFEQLESYYGLGIASGTSNTPVDSSAPKMSYSEYREKTATKKVADLNTAVQQYFRDYQAFADSALYDLQNADYHNAELMRDIRVQTAKELRKRANTLASTLHMNSDIIPGDYNKLHSLIASTQTGVGIIMDTFDSQVKHYSQWATEEEYKYQNMSADEIMAEQKARAAMIKDFGIVFELSRTNMPYDWSDAEYWGYTRADFDEVDRKRKYIEEKYGVDLYTDIYESEHIYNDLLDELASLDTDIAYTTADGQNVTLQMLYDWKLAEEKSAVWQQKYSDKSYAELQKVIAGLAEGEEKSWLLNYAEAKKTKDDWKKELSYSQAELDYLLQLQTERDRLMEWQAMSSVETPGYVELKKRWESYHNQFDGLDERIDALEKKIWKQERIVRYYDLSQNEDFAEKSQYHGGGSVLQQMVNNPEVIGLLDNAAAVGELVGSLPEMAARIYDDLTFDNLQYLENTERADFNYLHETEGAAAAKEYLQWLQPTLNERSMNKKMERVAAVTQSVPVLSQTVASLWSIPMKLGGGGLGMIDAIGQEIRNDITGENKPIDYNTDAMFYSKAAGTIRNTVAQNIVDATGYIDLDEEDHPILSRLLNGKSLADVYQFGMGMLDSAAVAALAAINPVLGKAGVALLATSSGTDAMLDAVSRGASDEQALTMGLLTAGFEMIFEKYELESLLGQGTNVWQALWRQGLSEAVGEGATETANILADIAVMAEKSQWSQNISRYLEKHPDWDYNEAAKQAFIDAALQVGEASFGGLISGSAMGSTYAANTRFNQADVTKRLMDKGFNPEKAATMADAITARLNGQDLTRTQTSILRSAIDSPTVQSVISDIQKTMASQGDKVSQKPTARNVGQSNTTVQAAINRANTVVNQADVAKNLRSKGVYSKEVDGIAEAITARLKHQDLTRPQQNLLSFALNTSAVRDTISEFINRRKTYTGQSSQNIPENMLPDQTSGDSEKLQQYQIPKRRSNEFSEATDFLEQQEQRKKSGGAGEHEKESENTNEERIAASVIDFFSAKSEDDLKSIILRSTMKLKNGFACFPEGDALNTNVKEVAELDGVFDVAMHGTPTAVGFGSEKTNMSARTLATVIHHSKGYNGQKIRLLSCSTGRIVGDEYCFAEELANALGVDVIAPDDILYISSKGILQVGDAGDGKFVTFKPNQRRRIK